MDREQPISRSDIRSFFQAIQAENLPLISEMLEKNPELIYATQSKGWGSDVAEITPMRAAVDLKAGSMVELLLTHQEKLGDALGAHSNGKARIAVEEKILAGLQRESYELLDKIEQYEKRRDDLSSLEADYAHLQSIIKSDERDIATLKEETKSLQAQVEQYDKDSQTAKGVLDLLTGQGEEIEKKNKMLEEKSGDLVEDIRALKGDKGLLEAAVAKLEATKEETIADTKAAHTQMNKLTHAITELDEKHQGLQALVDELSEKKEALVNEGSRLDKHILTLKASVSEETEKLHSEKSELTEQITQLKEDAAGLVTDITAKRKKKDEFIASLQMADEQLAEITPNLEMLKAQQEKLEASNKTLAQSNSDLSVVNKTLVQDETELTAQVAELATKLEDLKQSIAEKVAEHSAVEKEEGVLNDSIAMLTREEVRLTQQLKTLAADKSEMEKTLEGLSEEMKLSEKEAVALREAIEALSKQKTTAQADASNALEGIEAEKARLYADIEKAAAHKVTLGEENKELANAAAKLHKNIAELSKEAEELQAKIGPIKSEYKVLRAARESIVPLGETYDLSPKQRQPDMRRLAANRREPEIMDSPREPTVRKSLEQIAREYREDIQHADRNKQRHADTPSGVDDFRKARPAGKAPLNARPDDNITKYNPAIGSDPSPLRTPVSISPAGRENDSVGLY